MDLYFRDMGAKIKVTATKYFYSKSNFYYFELKQ